MRKPYPDGGRKNPSGVAAVSKAKNNLIASAANAMKAFREKGKEALKNAVKAMKIPETLDKLGKVFHSFAVSMNGNVQNVQNARMELSGAKSILSMPADSFSVKKQRKMSLQKQDRGACARLQNLFAKNEQRILGFGTQIA